MNIVARCIGFHCRCTECNSEHPQTSAPDLRGLMGPVRGLKPDGGADSLPSSSAGGMHEKLSQGTLVSGPHPPGIHQHYGPGRGLPARKRHPGRVGAGQRHAHHLRKV